MRGVITLVFDDGYQAVYDHVVPLLEERGLPAVFALPLKTLPPARPWPEWLHLQQAGHELAAHSITHRDLRTLSNADCTAEIQHPHDELGATTFVYPGGAHNETVVEQVKLYYTAARTTRYGFESLPPIDPWRLKTVDYTRDNWSLISANCRAFWAWAANVWLIETYHMIQPKRTTLDTNEAIPHHTVPLAGFIKHLDFITKLPVSVKTIHEVISHRHH